MAFNAGLEKKKLGILWFLKMKSFSPGFRHKKRLEEAEKKVKEAEEQYKQLMDKVEESHKERIRDMMFNGPNQFNMFLRQSDGMVQTASSNTPIRNQQNDNFMGNLQQVTPLQQNQQLPQPLLTKEERLQRIERFLKNNILRDCNRVTEDTKRKIIQFLYGGMEMSGPLEENVLIHEEIVNQEIRQIYFHMDHSNRKWKKIMQTSRVLTNEEINR
ncbi:hypothetical protein ABK040_004797 [Willaertia magna]